MEIRIKTIPHSQQRYETPGDYWYDANGVLQIRVSDLGNSFFETMVSIHEMVEEALTKMKGISEQSITDFDLAFEKARVMGLRTEDEEPGFHNDSPYLLEHTIATSVELIMCAYVGVKWNDYNNAFKNLK